MPAQGLPLGGLIGHRASGVRFVGSHVGVEVHGDFGSIRVRWVRGLEGGFEPVWVVA